MTHIRPNNPKAQYFQQVKQQAVESENGRLLNAVRLILFPHP